MLKQRAKKTYKAWTKEEEHILVGMVSSSTILKIAHTLNRSTHSIKKRLQHLGVSAYRKRPHKMWTKSEVNKLLHLIEHMSISQAANQLNRTYKSVLGKCYELRIIRKNGVYTKKRIAEIIGVNECTIRRHMRLMEITCVTDEEIIAKIAQHILDENMSREHCKASLKQLEKIASNSF